MYKILLNITLLWLSLFSSVLWSANVISNVATSTYSAYGVDKNISSNFVELTVEKTPAKVEFLIADKSGSLSLLLPTTQYMGSDGVWHDMVQPIDANGNALSTSSSTSMKDSLFYNSKDLVIVKLQDMDRDADNRTRDTVEVNVTSPTGDVEQIRLVETSINSGVFVAYIVADSSPTKHGDGKLSVKVGDVIKATYVDNDDIFKTDTAKIVENTELKIWTTKSVDKTSVSVGELLMYTVEIHSDEEFAVDDVMVYDYLPFGVKYMHGTARLDGVLIDANISTDGKRLEFKVPSLAPKSKRDITFLAQVGAGVINARVTNTAWCSVGSFYTSSKSTVSTRVVEDLQRSSAIIIGRVHECKLDSNGSSKGIGDIRIYMEDGTYVTTDKEGRYHIEGVDVGEHVVQMDVGLLPNGYSLPDKISNSKFAGNSFSQFIKLGKGSLKRADFCLVKSVSKKGTQKATSGVADLYDYIIPTSVAVMPQYDESYLSSVRGKSTILWPPEDFIPNIPSTKISISYKKSQKAEVWLNGRKVSMLNYVGKINTYEDAYEIALYKGVDLLDGLNTIKVKILSKSDKVLEVLKRVVYISSKPAYVEYIKENSYLDADGKHEPVIAVKFTDVDGYPLRSGMTGTFTINAPYSTQEVSSNKTENILTNSSLKHRYTVHSDGIAYIKLEPTIEAGRVEMHFDIADKDEVIVARLNPKLRDWIMVGFTQGSIGYNKLDGHKEALDAKGTKDGFILEGETSFFAKGKVLGKYLMTISYDSSKESREGRLFQEIDPKKYYTLYNDNSNQKYETPSSDKLYIKVENANMSAMYGDFDTGMSYTELSKYSRRLSGLKSEYHNSNIDAIAFASYTDKLFLRDEIRADGTSGYYYLKEKSIVENSETITVEVRGRYHDETIVQRVVLTRYKDYDIDYASGSLYFKSPLFSNDVNFNPRYIVAEYETIGGKSKHYTYGGRGVYRTLKGALEVGGTLVSEDTALKLSKLYGSELSYKIDKKTTLRAEYARSVTKQDDKTIKGDASLVELEYTSSYIEFKAYYAQRDSSFGLGQLSEALGGTRRYGVEATKTFDNRVAIKAEGYRDANLLTDTNRDVFNLQARLDRELWSSYVGYRWSMQSDVDAVNHVLFGGSYSFLKKKLKLIGSHEQTLGEGKDKKFPTKTTVGLEYALSKEVKLFAKYEFATGASEHTLGRVGVQYQPWEGMTMENSTNSEYSNDSVKVYNTLGMRQEYKLDDNWTLSGGFENGHLVDGNVTQVDMDFSAYSLGVAYQTSKWAATLRGQYRDAKDSSKYNINSSLYTQVNHDLAFALSVDHSKLKKLLREESTSNARVSVAYRPKDNSESSSIVILDKLDIQSSGISAIDEEINTDKMINNMVINMQISKDMEISVQHGIKHTKGEVAGVNHSSVTQLVGVDMQYEINDEWYTGLQASVLYAHSANNLDYSYGIYAGYLLFDNALVEVGYNAEGFTDSDFDMQTYRIDGVYVKFKMKLDQESLKDVVGKMSL